MIDRLPVSLPLLVPIAATFLAFLVVLTFGKVPLGYNLRNLVVRWRITVLTLLAFVLVLSLLTVMLAFVNGMTRLAEGSGHPGNVLVLSKGATDELMSSLAISDVSEVELWPGIVAELRDGKKVPICSREVYVVVAQPVEGATGDRPRRRLVQLRGVEDPQTAARVRGLELLPGGTWCRGVRSASSSDSGQTPDTLVETVVGEGIAREWGLALDSVFEVGPRRCVVVGVTKSAGTTFGSEVWADCRLVGQLFNKEGFYTSLVLRTPDAVHARQVSDDLTQNYKKPISAQPERDYYTKLAETNEVFLYSAYVVALVMAIGGVFGVMNTMFAAISQRSKDIGVLRLLGFARWQILVSFLLESLMLALVGGSIGCALGYLFNGITVTSFLENRTLVFRMIVDANTLAIGILFTLCMGGLGGMFPALSAMRIRPLDSLR